MSAETQHGAPASSKPHGRLHPEGTCEVKMDDGPVRTLKVGEVFYEAPNACHLGEMPAQATPQVSGDPALRPRSSRVQLRE
jgi:hypothetical protein